MTANETKSERSEYGCWVKLFNSDDSYSIHFAVQDTSKQLLAFKVDNLPDDIGNFFRLEVPTSNGKTSIRNFKLISKFDGFSVVQETNQKVLLNESNRSVEILD